ncbi:POK18 protein, partial [Calyptomena viridis]|nr:POK18 protein [Calyptomena viridis]
LQKLLGSINWVRPYLGFTSEQLSPLFALLKGDRDLCSTRTVAAQILSEIDEAMSECWVCRIELDVPITLFVIFCGLHPTGIIGQWNIKWKDPLHIL